ncbi:glycosyl hydrolase family 18 protein [Curtobacterium sp. MCSS17_007]|uniref:glycosyl hydrolase family 18 protein n=1 Tax=Curtobacterium sp. MCSS17_007 TaxID=2175646 RepID=UPI0015E8E249|nr:glycosyl hydrolase family 18 protein [Curtobacterium sp. MCSS17_007]WIE75026.1 glycosyl hydrolase family 18 protein [Curtobacterium sp. MCSS17_007]
MIRWPALAVAVVLATTALSGCAVTPRTSGPVVEAYVEPGTAAARVRAATEHAATIGIDGVTLTEDGAGLAALPDEVRSLVRTAHRGGAEAELLVSNFSESLGDFSPDTGTALLADPATRRHVARELAVLAARNDLDGVQIDLESLRARDRAGLVAFAAALESAVHDELGAGSTVTMAVMASTSAAGFRDTGYDLPALAEHVDRFVLMTYDQHGPWSEPGTVGALPWAERVVETAEHLGVPAERIDLGIAGYGYLWGGRDAGQVSPARARRLAGGAARWSERTGEWSATLADGRELHWSDARSYRVRVALAQRLGLHGVALWSLTTEALPG